jgi:hypothetical protein
MKVNKIIVNINEDIPVEFVPKFPTQIIHFYGQRDTHENVMFPVMENNGLEVQVIISAPDFILTELNRVIKETVQQMINT